MFRRLLGHMKGNAVAYVALFVALGGTSAYAANTVFSTDIVDGQVKSVDIGDGEVKSADVKDQSLTTFDVSTFLGADIVDGSLTGSDLANDSVGGDTIADGSLTSSDVQSNSLRGLEISDGSIFSQDIADNTVTGADVSNDSLTGADINEATLNLPQTPTTATFAFGGPTSLSDTLAKVASKSLPAGNYAVIANAQADAGTFGADEAPTMGCQLRENARTIGTASETRSVLQHDSADVSLSLNGGAILSSPGEVSLWCNSSFGYWRIGSSQILIIRLDGFS